MDNKIFVKNKILDSLLASLVFYALALLFMASIWLGIVGPSVFGFPHNFMTFQDFILKVLVSYRFIPLYLLPVYITAFMTIVNIRCGNNKL